MYLNPGKLDKIESLWYVQNVQNNQQYYFTGMNDFFIDAKAGSFITKDQLVQLIADWMFDELYIFRASIHDFGNLDELFYYAKYLENDCSQYWMKAAQAYETHLLKEHYTISEFKETFGWSIQESLFAPNHLLFNFDFDVIKNPVCFGKPYNPLSLGCVLHDTYFIFSYNGYI